MTRYIPWCWCRGHGGDSEAQPLQAPTCWTRNGTSGQLEPSQGDAAAVPDGTTLLMFGANGFSLEFIDKGYPGEIQQGSFLVEQRNIQSSGHIRTDPCLFLGLICFLAQFDFSVNTGRDRLVRRTSYNHKLGKLHLCTCHLARAKFVVADIIVVCSTG